MTCEKLALVTNPSTMTNDEDDDEIDDEDGAQ